MATLAHPVTTPGLAGLVPIDVDAIETGVSLDRLNDFLDAAGLELKDIYDVVIPARTLTHRRARNERLSRDESDKLARLVRIYELTLQVFGSKEKATYYLSRPKKRFAGKTPLHMLRTDAGGRLVEESLWQIAEGMFV